MRKKEKRPWGWEAVWVGACISVHIVPPFTSASASDSTVEVKSVTTASSKSFTRHANIILHYADPFRFNMTTPGNDERVA